MLQAAIGSEEVVLRDLQRHPAKPFIEHADFLRIVAGEALRMSVPLHFVGEEECPGVADEDGVVQHNMNDIEIECLPRNLPEYIEVDCSKLHLHDSVHLSELVLPEGVEIVELMGDEVYPGDVFVHNDPYYGNNQAQDTAVFKPVFSEGKLAFWTGAKGHLADLGGAKLGGAKLKLHLGEVIFELGDALLRGSRGGPAGPAGGSRLESLGRTGQRAVA